VAAAIGTAALAPAFADEKAVQGRALVNKWQGAVVTLEVVAKITTTAEGREMGAEESKLDACGTVIDPSGLVAASLTQIDPTRLMGAFMGEEEGYQMKAEITDVKIRLADGTEIPARVVLRDSDLDLAFIRPKDPPAAPMVALSLSDAVVPAVLDEILVIQRFRQAANRVAGAQYDRIQAAIDKPRSMYVVSTLLSEALGCPVLSLDGKFVGILSLRMMKGSHGGGMMSGSDTEVLCIVLPAGEMAEPARQAMK
jgi:hypothetical protein